MTDMTMNNNGNKKKYLVPVLVLLLCGVALTGAAYAYTSNITAGDDIDVKSYEIQFGTSQTVIGITNTLVFDTETEGGVTTYTLDTNETGVVKVTASIKNGHNTTLFKVLSADATLYTDSTCTTEATGLSVEAAPDNATGAATHDITFTFTQTDDDLSSVLAKYYVKLVLNTEAVAAQA